MEDRAPLSFRIAGERPAAFNGPDAGTSAPRRRFDCVSQGHCHAETCRQAGLALSEDFDVGGDADMPGADQPVSLDDIDAIIHSPRGTVEERCATLRAILDDLEARHAMDLSSDLDELAERAREGLRQLQGSQGAGTPSSYGFDPDERADRPDEIQERRQSEPPEGEG